ncbi:hypothetical protein EJD96_03940 [Herbaspirillum seropedicae]|uniref:hypothetical protein n=1 Tax=Herbaspirillum seropedicae TaxID=964 RepID=UPI001122FC0F|nr:hypothetical protein [Herbaspirillum seropedicae]QDD63361.1 hypothetical protein EJD96_03940 [Herbaspirillum seropedicae]
MSQTGNAPAGWTWSHFKAVCEDVSSWTWGTVQGAFNEKASLSQILVDAVIGMIPLVGDATAVRDLIAVLIGMADNEEKRNSTWEWVLLVVLLFALIPVIGGVVKGAGRIIIKVAQESAHLSEAARLAHTASGAKEVIEFLNRIGVKNAEKWLLQLRITDHTAELIGKFTNLMRTIDNVLKTARGKFAGLAPSLARRIDGLRAGLEKVVESGKKMIPTAIKELDQKLRDIQAYIRSGGETTSRVTLHELATGERVTTRAQERRLIEDGTLPVRSGRGGFKQNPASPDLLDEIRKVYQHEPGYPNLMKYLDPETNVYNDIAAYSGKMFNRPLRDGETPFRLFGPECFTHGVLVKESRASGAYWGLGPPPKTAKEWREFAAVLDSFNGDGFMVVARVKGNNGPKAVVGTVAEQFGTRIPGQYLPGGATQAYIDMEASFKEALAKVGHDFWAGKGPAHVTVDDPATGMEFTFSATGWKDANGIWGYLHPPGAVTTQTARVGARENATKNNDQVLVSP